MKKELEKYTKKNDELREANDKLVDKNKNLDADIKKTLERIQINDLLKQVDKDDFKLLVENNRNINF